MDGYEGFGDIGALLGGIGQNSGQTAFMKGAQQGATLDRALAEAKIKRDQAMQRDGLRDKLAAAMPGAPPAQIELMAALTAGSESLGSGFSSAQQGFQRMHANEGITQAQALPLPGAAGYTDTTPDMLNQILAASGANGPLTPSTTQVMPQASAKIETERARGESSRASADKHRSDAAANDRKAAAQVDTEHARRDNVGKPKAKKGGAAPAADEKMIGGVRYVRRNGKWGRVTD